MTNIFETPLLVAFVAGCIVAWFAARLIHSSAAAGKKSGDHDARALQAELRVVMKNSEKSFQELREKEKELVPLRVEVAKLRAAVNNREGRIEKMKHALTEECSKTSKLRESLAEHATETVRARARVREVETEMRVTEVGSEAVHDEMNRLAAETAELTGQLQRFHGDSATPESFDSDEGGTVRR
jgi:chromosome segregation ATPase